MSAGAPPSLLSVLRKCGVSLAARGDRVVVDAPSDMATPELREAVATAKPEILQQLRAEEEILAMPLSQFAQSDAAIEVAVPWLSDTLWFVAAVPVVQALVRHGVARGR